MLVQFRVAGLPTPFMSRVNTRDESRASNNSLESRRASKRLNLKLSCERGSTRTLGRLDHETLASKQ